jgi:uncharacterized protein
VRAVGLNFRSCSGEPNRLARAYHSGDTGDIRHVLELLASRYPSAPRGAIGFSLGGNALLKLLGEEGAEAGRLVQAAVAVSVPYDLGAGADWLDQSVMGRFYTARFVKSLVAKTEAKGALMDEACAAGRVRAARSFRQFDDAVTAPIHGFRDAEDYYTQSSSFRFIDGSACRPCCCTPPTTRSCPATGFPVRRWTRTRTCAPWSRTAAVTSASSRGSRGRRSSGRNGRPAGSWRAA